MIEAETAFEIFIDSLLTLMLWEEQVAPADAAASYFADGLTPRIRKYYHPRLGGDWNVEGNGPTAGWAQSLAPLRGRVVHAGYQPSFAETERALNCLSPINDFAKKRLVVKRNQYMRTTLLILGRPGLEQRNAYNGQIRRFAESNHEPDWLASYGQWREEFILARQTI